MILDNRYFKAWGGMDSRGSRKDHKSILHIRLEEKITIDKMKTNIVRLCWEFAIGL